MRALEELGFAQREPTVPQRLADFAARTSLSLPDTLLRFLCYSPPPGRLFGFRFRRDSDSEEWEGQVEQFFDYGKRPEMLERSVLCVRGRVLLPIAHDAGGNELLLDLTSPGQPIVDLDYSTGGFSTVAPSFEAFMDCLYPIE